MSIVNIRNIELVNNPAKFDDEYHFRIKFEAIAPLAEDLEWRLIYVGSATGEEYDQELDSCMVGPIPAGINAFDFQAPAPAHHLLPSQDPEEVLGVTVIIITASYRDKEFVRVGYYVNTYYEDEQLKEEPGSVVQWDKLFRNVLIEKPKVTRFQNPWDSAPTPETSAFDQQPSQAQQAAPGGFSSGFTNGAGGFSNGAGAGAPAGGFSSSSDMLFNAPLPPPVKAVSAAGAGDMEMDG